MSDRDQLADIAHAVIKRKFDDACIDWWPDHEAWAYEIADAIIAAGRRAPEARGLPDGRSATFHTEVLPVGDNTLIIGVRDGYTAKIADGSAVADRDPAGQ